jgi:hypothetical protein
MRKEDTIRNKIVGCSAVMAAGWRKKSGHGERTRSKRNLMPSTGSGWLFPAPPSRVVGGGAPRCRIRGRLRQPQADVPHLTARDRTDFVCCSVFTERDRRVNWSSYARDSSDVIFLMGNSSKLVLLQCTWSPNRFWSQTISSSERTGCISKFQCWLGLRHVTCVYVRVLTNGMMSWQSICCCSVKSSSSNPCQHFCNL